MFDGITNSEFPPNPEAVAGYIDGERGDQPNAASLAQQFPHAHHLSIALDPAHDADCLDIEDGAADPESAAAWFLRQKARGVARPCLYAAVSEMEALVWPAMVAAGIDRQAVRLWSAHIEAGQHICGPKSCGELSTDADGTQWSFSAVIDGEPRNLDQSLLLPDFFGAPVPPKPPADWVFGEVRSLTVTGAGPHSLSLSWESPAVAMPLAVAWYEVTVRHGGQDIPAYPRVEPKSKNPQTWQGGGLKPGTEYTAMVRAVAATGGGHESPWVTVEFTTAKA
jgi:hypothetical protein